MQKAAWYTSKSDISRKGDFYILFLQENHDLDAFLYSRFNNKFSCEKYVCMGFGNSCIFYMMISYDFQSKVYTCVYVIDMIVIAATNSCQCAKLMIIGTFI